MLSCFELPVTSAGQTLTIDPYYFTRQHLVHPVEDGMTRRLHHLENFTEPVRSYLAGDESVGQDRQSVGAGKRVSVGVDLGGRRIFKKKNMCNLRDCSTAPKTK